MNKKTIYALFLVSLVAVFAYMVMASFDGRGVSVISPTVDNNYSGVLILNATINDSGTDIDNATNVTFFFYSDTDGSLVYNVTFENSSGNQSRFNTSVNTVTLLADDTYNITVNATNASKDNIENSSITGVLIDNTAPTITINTANNSFLGTSVTSLVFNVTVADSGSGVLTTVDLQNNSETNESASQVGTAASREFNRTVVLSELATGSNTLTVVANDTITAANGGINTNDSESIVVWVDNVSGPIIELNSTQYLQNYTWTTDTTPTLYFNFSDDYSPNASCELFVDETGYGVTDVLNNTATGLTANDSLSIGVHSWYVNCTDLGGFLNSSLENNPAFTLDVVSPITVTTPTNNSWTNGTEAGNVSFIFSFVSGLTNGNNTNDNGLVSCELYIENETGSVFNPAGVNTTALNDTSMTFTNNQSLVNGQATNWTINCSFNGTDITQAVNNDYFILNVDNATPTTPTLTSSASSSTSLTIAVSTSSDVVSCVDTDPDTSISGSGASWTITKGGLSPSTSYSFQVTCTDSASNSAQSASTAFSTSASGGGTGGSGGGVSTSATGSFSKEVWSSLDAGDTATVKVENGEIGISEVSFKVEEKTYGVWLEVEKVSTLDEGITKYGGKTYKTIQIMGGNTEKIVTSKNMATVKFTVKKTWLTENKVDKTSVALFRYNDDKWNELTTTMDKDDGTYVHYTAMTPGFSYFMIGEKLTPTSTTAEKKTTTTTKETTPTKEATKKTDDKKVTKERMNKGWIVALIVALLVIGGLVYFWKKK